MIDVREDGLAVVVRDCAGDGDGHEVGDDRSIHLRPMAVRELRHDQLGNVIDVGQIIRGEDELPHDHVADSIVEAEDWEETLGEGVPNQKDRATNTDHETEEKIRHGSLLCTLTLAIKCWFVQPGTIY